MNILSTLCYQKVLKFYLILFLLSIYSCQSKLNDDAKIQIIGLHGVNTDKIQWAKEALELAFPEVEIEVLAPSDIPLEFFVNYKSPRYRADSIIQWLKSSDPSVVSVLGITNQDVSTTKRDKLGRIKEPISKYQDWGVYGLGYLGKPGAVVSSFRLKKGNQSRLENRFKKVCIHEVGHNLGIPHCANKECVMTDAVEKISTVDAAKMDFCTSCASKLR